MTVERMLLLSVFGRSLRTFFSFVQGSAHIIVFGAVLLITEAALDLKNGNDYDVNDETTVCYFSSVEFCCLVGTLLRCN